MAVDSVALVLGVRDFVNDRRRVGVRLSNEVDLMAGLARQVSDQVHVLPGKVLMYEQIVHRSSVASLLGSRDPQPTCEWMGTLGGRLTKYDFESAGRNACRWVCRPCQLI